MGAVALDNLDAVLEAFMTEYIPPAYRRCSDSPDRRQCHAGRRLDSDTIIPGCPTYHGHHQKPNVWDPRNDPQIKTRHGVTISFKDPVFVDAAPPDVEVKLDRYIY